MFKNKKGLFFKFCTCLLGLGMISGVTLNLAQCSQNMTAYELNKNLPFRINSTISAGHGVDASDHRFHFLKNLNSTFSLRITWWQNPFSGQPVTDYYFAPKSNATSLNPDICTISTDDSEYKSNEIVVHFQSFEKVGMAKCSIVLSKDYFGHTEIYDQLVTMNFWLEVVDELPTK